MIQIIYLQFKVQGTILVIQDCDKYFIGFTVAIAFVALAASGYDFYNPVNVDVNIIVEPVTEIRFDHPNDIEMNTIS